MGRNWHRSLGYSTVPGLRNVEAMVDPWTDAEELEIAQRAQNAADILDALCIELGELFDAIEAAEERARQDAQEGAA